MAEKDLYYQGFMISLQDKIPHKATLANAITDLLAIDKDAVYRRLRGEVSFSFVEMAIIAKYLGISLDNIVGIDTKRSKPAQIIISRHVNPTETDYIMFNNFLDLLRSFKDEPNTKLFEAGNMIPFYLCYDYEVLTRYGMFRWNLASSYGSACPFHEITIPDRMRALQKECSEQARQIKSTHYVWDYTMFQRLVLGTKYFNKINLIRAADIPLIKNSMLDAVDDLEKMATAGKHPKTGNEISVYISDANIDTNYSQIKSKHLNITLFKVFILNASVSLDKTVFMETNSWIQAMQRTSTLISVSGEKIRAAFFNAQRELIDTL
jgi:hypothetical protein